MRTEESTNVAVGSVEGKTSEAPIDGAEPAHKENRFHVALHLISLAAGTLLGLGVACYVDHGNEVRHKRILIPVLIEGADRQGGQFTLGVSRAMEFAHRYRLDQIGEHRIDPWLLDERKNPEEIVQLLRQENPPIVVGPLRSTPALELVPRIAKRHPEPVTSTIQSNATSDQPHNESGLGIPVILGIPTNTEITQKADLVWRLSPTDDVQGDYVAKVYQATAHLNEPTVIIKDLRSKDKGGNPGYVMPLRNRIVSAIGALKLSNYPYLNEVDINGDRLTNDVQSFFEKQRPGTIIYLGMPDAALDVLRLAKTAGLNATWLFTDSCITIPQELIPLLRGMPGEFFITFQAPPAQVSKGLQLYIFYTTSTGGNVLFALDPEKKSNGNAAKKNSPTDKSNVAATGADRSNDTDSVIRPPCDRFKAAPTYEVFGFDSYLTALLVLREAADGQQMVSKEDVSRVFARQKMSDPLLIQERYEFTPSGDSKNTRFYLYEFVGDCTSYLSLAEVAARHHRVMLEPELEP